MGVLAAVLVTCVYGGLALSVNFPHVAFGFQSDEATYYMMAHSLASDGDLTYRREDLVRVWHEFPAGPSGLFLKKGRALDFTFDRTPPFVHVRATADPDQARLFYGKSFAYPMAVAPWVWALGTNGFLLFHALLLGLVVFTGFLFLAARSGPAASALLASGFVVASVAPAYVVWITPEIFNFSLVFLACFCWLYKEVGKAETAPRGLGWLLRPSSDLLAVVLLAIASFSKPSNALLTVPMGLLWLARRRWRKTVWLGLAFTLIVIALFAANVAVTGELNYQGGERRTYVTAFPFLPGGADFSVGLDRRTDRLLTEIIFGPEFWTVFRHNLAYFFVGRFSGLVPYFFPAVFALVAFALAHGRREKWQYLVLGAAVAEILLLLIWIPFNYFGGGGVLGNRYFMSVYGLFLFLLPPIQSAGLAVVPWVIGALFTAPITLNPFYSAFYPAAHASRGLLRLLPVEESLANDLPVNTSDRAKVTFGGPIPYIVYFLDGNRYGPGPDTGGAFWVRGESTMEALIRGPREARRLILTLTGGAVANTVEVRAAGHTRDIQLAPDQVSTFSVPLDEGFPYPGGRIWKLAVTSGTGFVPMFARGGVDNRFLGVQVKAELVPE